MENQPLSRQEIYNRVKAHLLTQMQKSVVDGSCSYRGPNGLKCAVGCLIPDELYSKLLEGFGTADIFENLTSYSQKEDLQNAELRFQIFKQSGLTEEHELLLSDLQYIHDLELPSDWKSLLEKTALNHGLIP